MSYQQTKAVFKKMEVSGKLKEVLASNMGKPISAWMSEGDDPPKPPKPCFDVF